MMAEYPDKEEQYLLRVHNKAVADSLRSLLRGSAEDAELAALDIKFSTKEGRDSQAREGTLSLDGKAYAIKRQDLPTIVECFKTYDDINLVKTGDIGQVIVLPEENGQVPEEPEARNGLTKAMVDARRRKFRKARSVDIKVMKDAENAILQIAGGGAPKGYEFVDEEEEFVVSKDGQSGSWQPYQPGKPAVAGPPAVPSKKPPTKRKPARRKDSSATPEHSQAGTEML